MGQYHDLYLKTDVLLLCDVFEKFINVSLKNYGLDPSHYFSSPAISWDAMLKFAGTQLEKTNNTNVHLFLEKGIRGGVSYISKRCKKSDENTEIIYWDTNNLYGWAMNQHLPHSSFMFLSKREVDNSDLNSIAENSLIGYILEVDLEYYKELHDLHGDYPLCPKKLKSIMTCYLDIVKILLIGMVLKLVELKK